MDSYHVAEGAAIVILALAWVITMKVALRIARRAAEARLRYDDAVATNYKAFDASQAALNESQRHNELLRGTIAGLREEHAAAMAAKETNAEN